MPNEQFFCYIMARTCCSSQVVMLLLAYDPDFEPSSLCSDTLKLHAYCRISKYQYYNLWFDSTHTLPHLRNRQKNKINVIKFYNPDNMHYNEKSIQTILQSFTLEIVWGVSCLDIPNHLHIFKIHWMYKEPYKVNTTTLKTEAVGMCTDVLLCIKMDRQTDRV